MPAPPDYIDVAQRIVEFRERFPDGSLQQVDLQFIDFAGKSWVVFTAAAYRTPDDPRPGHGTAWEPVPGPTNFTKDSELQNAETSAWGRALVAVLAADTKRGVASANEVRNRQPAPEVDHGALMDRLGDLIGECRKAEVDGDYETLVDWAAQGPENARAGIRKLEKALSDEIAKREAA